MEEVEEVGIVKENWGVEGGVTFCWKLVEEGWVVAAYVKHVVTDDDEVLDDGAQTKYQAGIGERDSQ